MLADVFVRESRAHGNFSEPAHAVEKHDFYSVSPPNRPTTNGAARSADLPTVIDTIGIVLFI